jgi:hypothetical protein
MPLVIRPASADELAPAEQLVVRTINDLTVRYGFGPIAASRPSDFQAFCLRDDPRGVWPAEDDGEIVGFALSWVCGRLWSWASCSLHLADKGRASATNCWSTPCSM